MLLQPYKSDFILAIFRENGENETRSNWKLMKNSEVNNYHKNKYGKLKNILSIWSFKRNYLEADTRREEAEELAVILPP